jgi:dihydroxyacetone kinase-like protein
MPTDTPQDAVASPVPPLALLLTRLCDRVIAAAEELTALDAAIGDGDHGINMRRGMAAARTAVAANPDAGDAELLRLVGTTLVMTVGGASGPLYGTLFLTLGKDLADAGPLADAGRARLAAAFGRAVAAVAQRGRAEAGDKTLLDVLVPVAEAFAAGAGARDIARIATDAAAATVPMKALRGRAAFLGDRSIGHLDPGARSCALLVTELAAALDDAGA